MADRGAMRRYALLVRWLGAAEIALNGGIVHSVGADAADWTAWKRRSHGDRFRRNSGSE